MVIIAHWGMFEPVATPMMPPLTWIAEICRLRKALEDNIASTKKMPISATYLKMIS